MTTTIIRKAIGTNGKTAVIVETIWGEVFKSIFQVYSDRADGLVYLEHEQTGTPQFTRAAFDNWVFVNTIDGLAD